MNDKPTKPKMILAIDDEPYMRDILKTVLEAEGYIVHTAGNGREGIELYKERWRDIQVVLLDFMMPEMTGDQVFDQLKQINPAAPILLVSGSADRLGQTAMLAKGIRGIIHKPFHLDELIRQVADVAGPARVG